MPYILPDRRISLHLGDPAKTAGELNYIFTAHIIEYLITKGINYQTYNDAIGALEACKLELYRRATGIYEDGKIKLNGDVGYEKL